MTGLERLAPDVREGIDALAAAMARNGKDRGAPVRAIMALLGDRWTTLILLVLATGTWRHADLKRILADLSAEQAISQRVLTLKLRTLERDGFVARAVSDHVPPRVSYALTPFGHALHLEARRMLGWIEANADQVKRARAAFDAAD